MHRVARVSLPMHRVNVNARLLPNLPVLPRVDVEMRVNVPPVERNVIADPSRNFDFLKEMNPLTPPPSRAISRTTSALWTSREIHSPKPVNASSPVRASLNDERPEDQVKRIRTAEPTKDPRRLALNQFKDMDDYVSELESELVKKEGRIQSMEKTKAFLRTRVALLEDQIERLKVCGSCGSPAF